MRFGIDHPKISRKMMDEVKGEGQLLGAFMENMQELLELSNEQLEALLRIGGLQESGKKSEKITRLMEFRMSQMCTDEHPSLYFDGVKNPADYPSRL